MNQSASINQDNFRQILLRNISLPLGLGALNAALFLGLILYLVSALNWVEHTERVIGNANDVSRLSSEMDTGMNGFLSTGDESFLQVYDVARSNFDGQINALSGLVRDNPVQVKRLRHVAALQQQWNEFSQETISLKRRSLNYVQALRTGRGKSLMDEIRQELSTFATSEQRLLLQRNTEARTTTFWGVMAYLMFILGVSGLLAFFGRRELIHLTQAYGDVLKKQTFDAEQLQQQSWLRNGQTRLAEQILGQSDMAQLGQCALAFLAHYLDVPVAALYILEDEGSLRRIGTYGFSPASEHTEQTFYTAQGLIGQVAAENRILQLDNVPGDYLKVSSGLGQSSPTHVLVVPLHHDTEVSGVVELAFFRALAPRDLELVKIVANSIGTALHGVVYRQRLQEALAKTQQLNQELQVQEELRAVNEELEEQSRVLTQSQAMLKNQQSELEQTNRQLAEQALSLDHKNRALESAQAQLEARAEELTRASHYKSEFLANMSHELRTPLNSSLILAKLLSENPQHNLSEEQVRFAQSIYASGNDLLDLINDILDISKVEAGKLELVPEHLTLAKLVDSLKNTFEPLAQQKKLAFEIRIDPDVPATVLTDRQRVEQILKNLLSNAIKFTESGTVRLVVSAQPGGGVALEVQDSGIGISQDQQGIIFEAFRQADGTISRHYGGTGLGLSISRDLSILLGGSISVESAPDQGSIFTLRLPAQLAEAAPPAGLADTPGAALVPSDRPAEPQTPQEPVPSPDRMFEGRKILLVDDDVRNIFALTSALEKKGLRVEIGRNGLEALSKLDEVSDIELVLMDIMMPGMDGLEATRRIRLDPRFQKLPIIAVTAKAMKDDQEQCLNAGINAYLAKPIDFDRLFSLLQVWMPALEEV